VAISATPMKPRRRFRIENLQKALGGRPACRDVATIVNPGSDRIVMHAAAAMEKEPRVSRAHWR
jgi:hypothetical protein